jgi:hypothetical protein
MFEQYRKKGALSVSFHQQPSGEWLVDRLTQGQTLQEGPVTERMWTTLIVWSANKDTLETTLFHLSDVLYAEGRVIDGETVNI